MRDPLKKIVWAIDAYQEPDDRIWKNIVETICALAKFVRLRVTPIYVLRSVPPYSDSALLHLPSSSALRQDAVDALKKRLKEVDIPGLEMPKVIEAREFSTTGDVKTLIDFAKNDVGADLILTGTHGRSGVSRLFVGSFAESVLLYSDVPLLVVGAGVRMTRAFDHILFPTDFGKHAKLVFEHVLALARQLRARLTILNVIRSPMIVPLSVASTRRSYDLLASMKAEKKRRRELAAQFAKIAAQWGVEADVLVRTSGTPISETIRRSAKALQTPLIAMAAHSGRMSAMFAGSTARQVVRSADCPVWLFHEKGFSRAQRRKAA
jgi:nucleotide-binding universal stress UspA family protein